MNFEHNGWNLYTIAWLCGFVAVASVFGAVTAWVYEKLFPDTATIEMFGLIEGDPDQVVCEVCASNCTFTGKRYKRDGVKYTEWSCRRCVKFFATDKINLAPGAMNESDRVEIMKVNRT